MIKPILVVEDDKKIARVVRVYLEGAGYKVVTAETAKVGLDEAAKELPILAVLDIMLPDRSGEELIQDLREMGEFPIIFLTAKSSEDERIAGFALGADDYIVKPFSPRELVYRVKAILKRNAKNDGTDTERFSFNDGDLVIDGQTYVITKKGKPANITPTEFKIIYVLARTAHKVFTRDELSDKALGYQFEGYERSIDAHIKNIRQKIEDDPKTPAYITTIYGVGYRFSGRPDA